MNASDSAHLADPFPQTKHWFIGTDQQWWRRWSAATQQLKHSPKQTSLQQLTFDRQVRSPNAFIVLVLDSTSWEQQLNWLQTSKRCCPSQVIAVLASAPLRILELPAREAGAAHFASRFHQLPELAKTAQSYFNSVVSPYNSIRHQVFEKLPWTPDNSPTPSD